MSEENLYTFENPEYRKTFWHTSSHVMAQAVKRLWPEVQLAIGPAIDEGWYYDFDAPFSFTPDHLSQIEAEMKKIVKERIRLERTEKSREEAIAWAEANNEPYKKELIEDLPEDAVISFYTQGDFTDLCAGPHLDHTGRLRHNGFKLTKSCGAYWRGDSNRKMLQRIYGIGRQVVDEFGLVGLVLGLGPGQSLLPGLLAALQADALLDDLLHLRLDLGQMVRGEGEGSVKVVVPALVDGGADGKLYLRPQALDGLSHDVGAGVPEGLAVLGVFERVQVFFGHGFYLLLIGGRYRKIPPLKNQGWDTIIMYSTVPPWLQLALSLIDAITGVPGMAFPRIRLRSGIAAGRVTGPFHHAGPSLSRFPAARVFVTAFDTLNLSQFSPAVNALISPFA